MYHSVPLSMYRRRVKGSWGFRIVQWLAFCKGALRWGSARGCACSAVPRHCAPVCLSLCTVRGRRCVGLQRGRLFWVSSLFVFRKYSTILRWWLAWHTERLRPCVQTALALVASARILQHATV
jgi:hypothetical protein